MSILVSNLNTSSKEYQDNYLSYSKLSNELQDYLKKSSNPETPDAIKLSRQRNKFLSSERIELLIDPGAPILQLSPLAGMDVDGNTEPGAGITTCISYIFGRPCVIVANNPNVKGGTYFPSTVKKHLRAQEIAAENKLPCIYLVDSGGAYLPLQDQIFPDRFHFGRIFYNQAQMSSQGIPQISAVLGSCTAGGAYVPAMSDETIIVKNNGTIFLGGPPLVKAATGEEVTAEELGGAEVHCKISGVADHLAENEEQALSLVRGIIKSLGNEKISPYQRLLPEQENVEPLYPAEEIYGIINQDIKKTFSMKEILARLLDGSRLEEFKANYGTSLICGFAHIYGFPVGVIANDGILFSESALKATHFIELCNQRNIPLLFLHNITGFMVGKAYEHEGIAKHGAKMVSAVATSRVPKFSLLVGSSYGAGNYGMCGRAYDPRFLFSWPNSKISVMGGMQAAKVLTDVKTFSAKRKGEKLEQGEIDKYSKSILEKYEREGSPYYATARLWDDGVIDPVNTRKILALAFSITAYNPDTRYTPGIFRM